MRHRRIVVLSLCLLLMFGLFTSAALAQEATEEPMPETTEEPAAPTEESIEDVSDTVPEPGVATYTVQRGDNLFRIALRFNTTTAALAAENGITNPRLIFVGQVLRIPGTGPTPPPTDPPVEGTYTVQRGDNLYRIALRNNTTVAELVRVNNIANPNIVFVGQVLRIPGAPPAEVPVDEEAPVVEDEAPPLGEDVLEDPGFDFGVEVFFRGQDSAQLTDQVNQLGMNWVKVRANWSELETEQNEINFAELESVITALEASGLNILLTVTNAPAWSRTSEIEEGPPDDLSTFTTFIGRLAEQYSGRVAAYEIWDEPNLRRNWSCVNETGDLRMCDTDYAEMLREAYAAIKAVDPDAQVISAGLAPTRFNDRVNAIDDRLYLETLYNNGLAEFSDAIGAHPGGAANPPDATCCEPSVGVDTHFENDSFYFQENLAAYREIMLRYGDGGSSIWVTRFGWGTSEDTDDPSEINIYVTYTSLTEQAIYLTRAFELGQELGYIGPMILDNLNGCVAATGRAENCYYSLVAPDGTQRPAFSAVAAVEKPARSDVAVPVEPVPFEPEDDDETGMEPDEAEVDPAPIIPPDEEDESEGVPGFEEEDDDPLEFEPLPEDEDDDTGDA